MEDDIKTTGYGNNSQTQLQSTSTNSTSLDDDCKVHDLASIKVDQIVGIKNCENVFNQDPDLDSIGILRSWTRDYANVWIIKLHKTAQIHWRDLFLCVPWDHETNDYTFTFIQTLHSTQFFAMTSILSRNYDWEPICDDYNQLKQNVNKSSQEIQFLLKNGKTKVLPSYLEVYVDRTEQNTTNVDDSIEKHSTLTKIIWPSIIQKIPIVNSKQYWQKLIQMDANIVNLACKIPDKVMMHVQELQTIAIDLNKNGSDSQLHKISTT